MGFFVDAPDDKLFQNIGDKYVEIVKALSKWCLQFNPKINFSNSQSILTDSEEKNEPTTSCCPRLSQVTTQCVPRAKGCELILVCSIAVIQVKL